MKEFVLAGTGTGVGKTTLIYIHLNFAGDPQPATTFVQRCASAKAVTA